MTERLASLLRDQAGGVAVPDPSTETILARGRRERRKRRGAVALGTAAAVAVVGGGALATAGLFGGDGEPDAAAVPDSMVGPVFTIDTTVYYGPELHTAEISDEAVKSLFYTSAGVVVRHGENSESDGGGPQRFSLVRADGKVERLGLVTEGTVHASDSDQPYLAYGENRAGSLEVVVYDVLADAEVARIPVTGTEDNWFPLSIDGANVFVQAGHEGGVHVVDWRRGEAAPSDVLQSVWAANGGRVGDYVGDKPVVRDAVTGEVLVTGPPVGYFEVSPDGRYAGLVDEEGSRGGETDEYRVYDLATGDHVTFDGYVFDYGWTPDGDLFQLGEDSVTTCDTATGECTETAVDLPEGVGGDAEPQPGDMCEVNEDGTMGGCHVAEGPRPPEVRLGGRAYES